MVTLPPEISYDYISTIKYTGKVNTIPNITVRKGKNNQQLLLENCIPSYMQGGLGLLFSLEGLKNPSSSKPSGSFIISTFDEKNFPIETLDNGLTVSAAAGNLGGVLFFPTDQQGIRLYSNQQTVQLKLSSQINSDAEILLIMDNDAQSFYLDGDRNCYVEGFKLGVADSDIKCQQNSTTRSIMITNFINKKANENQMVSFTLKNTKIRNPISVLYPGSISIRTQTPHFTIDTGRSELWFGQPAALVSAEVRPNTLQTSIPNTDYLFTLTAPGQILQDSVVTVDFPPEVAFSDV